MPQEPSGTPYASANPSGIGAVYFEPYSAQKQHEANLDLFLEGVKNRADAGQKKKELASKMLGDMSVDPKNIMDTDVPELSAKAQELQQFYAQALKSGLDPDNPAFIDANMKAQQLKQQLQFSIAQSAAERKLLETNLVKYDPNKHDDLTLKRLTEYQMTPLSDRAKFGQSLIVAKKPSLNEYLQKYSKGFADKMQTKAEVLPPNKQGQIIERKMSYSMSPTGDKSDFLVHAQDIMTDAEGGKVVEENWALAPESEQKSYVDAYIAQGDPPSVAEMKAKQDWLADNLSKFNVIQRTDAYKGETTAYKEGVKDYYGQKKEAEKGRILPEYIAQMKVGDPAVMKKTVYPWPTNNEPKEVYGSRGLNGYSLGSVQVPIEGNQRQDGFYDVLVKDNVAQVEKVENYPTLIYTDDKGNLQLSTVESERLYKVGKTKSPFIPFQTEGALLAYLQSAGGKDASSIYGTADQQKKYIEQTGAGKGGVDYDARKILGWKPEDEERATKARGFSVTYEPVAPFGGLKQTTPKAKTKAPIVSDGKDIAKWVPDNEYQVGGWIYYNENGQWQKRQK